jgi:NAD(P)-dependent dehydrogenase (short-subunit alcohol dehydrogenase family)
MTTPSPPGTILITGANGGLGSALAKTLSESADLSKLHAVYTVRNVETATSLKSALTNAKPDHKHDIISLDLSNLTNVRQVAATLNKRVANGSLPPIRAFIHNAAFQEQTTQSFTGDGFDMSFQCNYLSHWLLVMLLLESMDKENGRIVVVGSSGHE